MKLVKDLGVMKYPETAKTKRRWGIYECPDCLKHYHVQTANVKSGKSTKCRVCSAKKCNITHGASSHPLHNVWQKMKNRCYNINNKNYKTYGNEGVTVCDEWKTDFKTFYDWALKNGWEKGLQLDKDILCNKLNINPKIYSPSTCVFVDSKTNAQATRVLQSNNTTGYRGVTMKKQTTIKYQAQISVSNKKIHIGYADTALEAAKLYDKFISENSLKHTRNFNDE